MSADNPYEAPSTPLADVERVVTRRPVMVTVALVVEWILFVPTTLGVARQLGFQDRLGDATPYFAYLIIVLLIVPAWLFVMIGRGRNWARIAATAFLGLDLAFQGYLLQFAPVRFWATLVLLPTLKVIALMPLYLPASNAWFRARRVADAGPPR